jgi:hypothetical protein
MKEELHPLAVSRGKQHGHLGSGHRIPKPPRSGLLTPEDHKAPPLHKDAIRTKEERPNIPRRRGPTTPGSTSMIDSARRCDVRSRTTRPPVPCNCFAASTLRKGGNGGVRLAGRGRSPACRAGFRGVRYNHSSMARLSAGQRGRRIQYPEAEGGGGPTQQPAPERGVNQRHAVARILP